MPRKGYIAKREVAADPVYNSTLVTKFVNSMMWGGKKSTAQGIFYTAMTNLALRVPLPDVRIFVAASLIQKESGGNLAEGVLHQMQIFDEQVAIARHASEQLRVQTQQLVTALRRPEARGRWGELRLPPGAIRLRPVQRFSARSLERRLSPMAQSPSEEHLASPR